MIRRLFLTVVATLVGLPIAAAEPAKPRVLLIGDSIAIDDLYGFAMPQLDKLQKKNDVHFSKPGSAALATQVVESVHKALERK